MFGTGPRGLAISFVLLIIAFYLKGPLSIPNISINLTFRVFALTLSVLFTIILVSWSVISLPAKTRGNRLVTEGAFKYFRHPLYAAFLLFFNFGLAIFLNNWIFIIWAIILHPIWHINIIGEEKLMLKQFPDDYKNYCLKTGRFIPKLA